MELDQDTIQRLREKGKEDLFFLAKAILGFHEMDKKIHKPICDELQNFASNTRVTVELPRTWFKSTMVSISYSIWRAINDLEIRLLIVQNTYDNACKKLSAIKDVFEKNQLFRALYPDILPNKQCRWSGECLELNRNRAHPEGTFEAAGVGTATTSRHYDVIIEDDTISPKKDDMSGLVQQPTKMDMEKAIGWHKLCHPMLLHPRESQVVIVGTRWAERDLLGYVYENFPDYKNFRMVACEKNGQPCTLEEGGIPTWPERFSEEVLIELARVEGPYMYACLYLGTPTAAINQVFKRSWVRYFSKIPQGCYACTAVDLASAEKEESSDPDFNVVMTSVIEPKSGRIFIQDYWRERANPGEVINEIFNHYRRFRPIRVKVEAIGYQRTLVHWIKHRQKASGVLFAIEQIKSHKQSKEERVRALQPYFADGLVAFRTGMTLLEQELLAFPKAAHDDLVDTLSMMIDFWVEMTELTKLNAPPEPIDPFNGGVVIEELLNRFDDVSRYPYDGGILDDYYLTENVKSDTLRLRIRNRMEEQRVEELLM